MADEACVAMTRAQLRVYALDDWSCGCGDPAEAARTLLRLLELHPLYDNADVFEEWLPDGGVRQVLTNLLYEREFTEHGSSMYGFWLASKGEAALAGLRRENELDGCEALANGPVEEDGYMPGHCIHGIDGNDPEHDCMAAPDPLPWRRYDLEPVSKATP